MLKMYHFRECVKKTTFCFNSKSVLCFCLLPFRDTFAVQDNYYPNAYWHEVNFSAISEYLPKLVNE